MNVNVQTANNVTHLDCFPHKVPHGKPSHLPSTDFINPFIECLENVFHNMLDCEIMRKEYSIKTNIQPSLDLVASVGLSGGINGIIALAFPIKTALALVSRVYESEIVIVDSMVTDAIGEFVNVIAGGAQAKICGNKGGPVDLGIPTVIRGTKFSIEYPSFTKWIEIPFTSNIGDLVLRITLKV